jgi:spermidine/putrescine transport system permease protein
MKPFKTGKLSMLLAMIGYLFLWVPVVVLCLFSFNSSPFGVRWESLTLRWYSELFQTKAILAAVYRSVLIASITTVVATIIGTLGGYGLYKYRFVGRRLLRMGILLPITVPYIIMAGGLLIYFTRIVQIPLGYPAIILAHISFSAPLAVFVTLGRMQRIDWSLEEASIDLGADRLTTWRKVVIPLLLPAIGASAVLIFPWSFNDFTITYFVAGIGTTTLPLHLYAMLEYSQSPVLINAISLVFIVLPTLGILGLSLFQQERQKAR